MAWFTSEGIKVSASEKLDMYVSFWRDVFKPIVSRALSRIGPSAGCAIMKNLPKQVSLAQVSSRDYTSYLKPTQFKPYLLLYLCCHECVAFK